MKQKQLLTNSVKSTKEEFRILKKLDGIIDGSIPKGILGMLLTAKETEDGKAMIFYNRYHLIPVEKNYYDIYDAQVDMVIFPHVTMLSSAVNIIYNSHNERYDSGPKEYRIYALDQQYYRCIEDIRFYKEKIRTADEDRQVMYSARLTDSRFKLGEIKTQLSKIF